MILVLVDIDSERVFPPSAKIYTEAALVDKQRQRHSYNYVFEQFSWFKEFSDEV